MNAAHAICNSSLPKLFEKNSKRYFIVDTGAEISVYPANRVDRLNKVMLHYVLRITRL